MRFVVPNLDDETTRRCIGWEQYENWMGPKYWPITFMHPREYLQLVHPQFGPRSSHFSADAVYDLQQAIRSGKCFGPLLVDPNSPRGNGVLFVHDGRHRAWLANQLGMTQVPVYVKP